MIPGFQSRIHATVDRKPIEAVPSENYDTTMMIRNIPTDILVENVVDLLNSGGFKGLYDYVHLPGEHQRSRGYAFVNFVSPVIATIFKRDFSGKPVQGERMLKVCEVLTANGHGFKYNIQHRVNTHGTKVFSLGSGDELMLPRDPPAVDVIIKGNKTVQDQIRSQLLNADPTESSLPDILRKHGVVTAAPKPLLSAPVAVDTPLPEPEHYLLLLPQATIALGDPAVADKLLARRMRWAVEPLLDASSLCERADELLTMRSLITDRQPRVVVCVSGGDVPDSQTGSAVLREFLLEALAHADACLYFEPTAAIPPELSTISSVRRVHNLLDLATHLRKITLA